MDENINIQKMGDNFELLCEDLLMHILSPDKTFQQKMNKQINRNSNQKIEEEITQLLTQKKNQIKEKIQISQRSLLKASIINCDIYPIVRYTKEILKTLFGICEFEVARIHNSQINTFSSRNIIQQSGVKYLFILQSEYMYKR